MASSSEQPRSTPGDEKSRRWRLLEFDEEAFGFPVAAVDANVPLSSLREMLAECAAAGVQLAYWTPAQRPGDGVPESLPWFTGYAASQDVKSRIELDQWQEAPAPAPAPAAAAAVAGVGAGADSMLRSAWSTAGSGESLRVASVPRGPAPWALVQLALEAGRLSRFGWDPVLCRTQYERLYGAWMHNSTQRLAADEVLAVYDATGTAVAFCTCKLLPKGSSSPCTFPLLAVARAYRRTGVGRLLCHAILRWAAATGAAFATNSTQADNAPARALYTQLGFQPMETTTTYHIWLAPTGGGSGRVAGAVPRPLLVPHRVHFLADSELRQVPAPLESGAVELGGPDSTAACTAWMQRTLGAHLALPTTSCTAALDLAALLCALEPGTEAILPSFTHASAANPIALRGATPVFVDVQPDTLTICPKAVAAAVTPRTRAIFVMHYGGADADMGAIMVLAEAHGLLVVEDAAHAFLTTYQGSSSGASSPLRGRRLGTIGHLGCFSFRYTCGKGGLVVVNEPGLAARAQVHYDKATNCADCVSRQLAKCERQDGGSSFVPSDR